MRIRLNTGLPMIGLALLGAVSGGCTVFSILASLLYVVDTASRSSPVGPVSSKEIGPAACV